MGAADEWLARQLAVSEAELVEACVEMRERLNAYDPVIRPMTIPHVNAESHADPATLTGINSQHPLRCRHTSITHLAAVRHRSIPVTVSSTSRQLLSPIRSERCRLPVLPRSVPSEGHQRPVLRPVPAQC